MTINEIRKEINFIETETELPFHDLNIDDLKEALSKSITLLTNCNKIKLEINVLYQQNRKNGELIALREYIDNLFSILKHRNNSLMVMIKNHSTEKTNVKYLT